MGCLLSIFRFGSYVIKESDNNSDSTQEIAQQIRKHSTTPVVETTPKQQKIRKTPKGGKNVVGCDKEKTLYTTTFETQVDAPPPHPLEEHFQDIQFDEIEIDTNLYTPEVEDAVVKIQAGVRGYLARKQVKGLRDGYADDQDVPLVPPPKDFDTRDDTLSPLSDLANWKKLSQHLEEKLMDDIERAVNSDQIQDNQTLNDQKLQNKLSENIIPLKDSNHNKVIETYVCKENILDVEPNDDKSNEIPVPPFPKDNVNEVVEKVFNVLLSETESENFVTNVDPIENNDNNDFNGNSETPESMVLSTLNEILDNNDQNFGEEFAEQTESQQQFDSNSETNVIEIVSQNTSQEIIKNSFKEFVKEMTKSGDKEDIVSNVEELDEYFDEPKVNGKTDSMIFEEEVADTIFEEEMRLSQTQNQIIAIEVFKHDIDDKQLANVSQIKEPEENLEIEDRVYKTSVDEFVVKPVIEKQISVDQSKTTSETCETIPVLETEQKIEIMSTESRKSSEDFVESIYEPIEEPVIELMEVIPNPSPIIQIEEQNGRPLDEEEAAIRIQAAFRGFQIRRSLSREASPNRSPNHNSIDNNNNNSLNSNNTQELTQRQTNDINDNNITTEELSTDLNNDLMSASNEQINTSLERLEDQLMQQLMAPNEDEDRNDVLIDDNINKNHLLDEMNANYDGLTSPMLLQRLQQQSVSAIDAQEVVQQIPESVPMEAPMILRIENSSEDQINEIVLEENKPLIQKSDTIIVDLFSSSPQKSNNSFIDMKSINTFDIQSNDNLNECQTQQNSRITTNTTQELLSESTQVWDTLVQTCVQPPTPSEKSPLEITPELSFIRSCEQPVLTKICSSESEQDLEAVFKPEIIESHSSSIPVLECKSKPVAQEKPKMPKPILKDKESQIRTNFIPEEQIHSTSEEISSPDDDNPEFVGLGPNTPIPVRASSPNPFGKKRRRGKKSGSRK